MKATVPGENLRLFVAVDIPDAVRERIVRAVDRHGRDCPEARWVKAENLHLTLKFIGSYEGDRMARLEEELRRAAANCPSFYAAMGGCGGFPSSRRSRVIWVGMSAGEEQASRIAARIDARLERVGVKREDRPFRGHLTLARLKTPRDCSLLLSSLEEELRGLEEMPFEVREITLYRSLLSSRGPTYIPLERVPLGERKTHVPD